MRFPNEGRGILTEVAVLFVMSSGVSEKKRDRQQNH